MNTFSKAENEILYKISSAFIMVGGVEPRHKDATSIKSAFDHSHVELAEGGPVILSCLRKFKESAGKAGLDLTVSDLSLVVELISNAYNDNAQDKSVVQPLLPPIYKGVSFNPKSFKGERSEWLVVLDFFSLMRQTIADQPDNQLPLSFAILDAGLYWIVNLLGEQGLRLTDRRPQKSAEQMIEQLFLAIENPQFSEVIQTNRTRNAYLTAIAEKFPANYAPPVLSLFDVWSEPDFPELLKISLELFGQFDGSKWSVVQPVKYQRYMMYSPWVTVLVAAEVALLTKRCGFKAELAPTAEAAWGKILSAMSNKLKFDHIIWMYRRKLAENIPYEAMPIFSDSAEQVLAKLRALESINNQMPEMVVRLIAPFMEQSWFVSAFKDIQNQF